MPAAQSGTAAACRRYRLSMTDRIASPAASQSARLVVRLGRRRRVSAQVVVTPGGVLAIGGLVSMILLSTAVLVRASAGAARSARTG